MMVRFLFAAALLVLAAPLSAQDSPAPADVPAPSFNEYLVLAQGDTLRGDVDIRDPFLGAPRVVLNDSTEYPLDQVVEVNNAEGNYAVTRTGLTSSPTLVRRVEAGRISLYSRTITHAGTWTPGPNGTQTYSGGGSSTYEYFRVGTGQVQDASTSNLRTAMADSPEALAIINRHRNLGIAQYALLGAGLIVAVVGVTQSEFTAEEEQFGPFAEESEPSQISPLLFVGAGVMLSSWIPSLARQGLVRDAIETYNR